MKNALVVPVDALLALASGGYALEVVSAKGVHSLEPVTLGLFDDADGLVQVTGLGGRCRTAHRGAQRMSAATEVSRPAARLMNHLGRSLVEDEQPRSSSSSTR